MRTSTNVSVMLALGFASGCLIDTSSDDSLTIATARLAGAIFTTLPDGTRVNANIYDAKTDVYLDGGPGNGAPQSAAALPDGDYYFQVTDPSGRVLLSTDAIACRRFTVTNGIITSDTASGACAHATGIDVDHNAVTVQLMPYLDTPNPGGEYKAWVTRVVDFNLSATRFHGFVPSESKTDNFKVRDVAVEHYCGDGVVDAGEECDGGESCDASCHIIPPPPPYCGDGHMNDGEQCDDGNHVNGDGCSSDCKTEVPPQACCGNGRVDAGEQCDDGNLTNGDGCSASCVIEKPIVAE